MKNSISRGLAVLFLFAVLGGSAWAQGRIATVDLRRVFDNYWKKQQAEAQLKERQADMQKEDRNLITEFERAREEYQTLLASANESALSTEERDRRKKTAEAKLRSLQELQVNIRQYEKTAETTILEQTDRMRSNILGDIRTVVNAKAKAGGYSMVIDTAAETINKTPVFLYSTNENDLTEAVLAQLNANAPSTTTPSDTAGAATDKDKAGKK